MYAMKRAVTRHLKTPASGYPSVPEPWHLLHPETVQSGQITKAMYVQGCSFMAKLKKELQNKWEKII